MSDIDFGAISEALNDKMDRDTNNIESPRLPIFLVDVQYPTEENDWTWYRRYSDNWVEFGFRMTWNGAWTTVTLPVPMRDAFSYTCTAGGYRTDSSPYQQMTCFRNYTSTTVDMWSSDDTTSNAAAVRVYGCGIAAE